MGWFDHHEEAYNDFHHKGSLTHEALSGAVAYEAARAYEKHCEKNGKPVDHAQAKALLVGFAGAALDGLVESKGLDAWDDYQRKRARDQATESLSETIRINEYSNY